MRVGVLSNKLYDSKNAEVAKDLAEFAQLATSSITALGHESIFLDADNLDLKSLSSKVDLVFNVCERLSEDPHREPEAAALLEQAGVTFTGSSSRTLAFCMDKTKVKQLLAELDISTPSFQVFTSVDEKLSDALEFPLITKPSREHNSIGITSDAIVRSEAALHKRIAFLLETYKQPVLVEKFIEGRDIEVSVIGNGATLEVLPFAHLDYEHFKGDKNKKIFSYTEKWDEAGEDFGDFVFDVVLDEAIEKQMKETALALYKAAGLRDYGRIDFRLGVDGVPYVLEITANPGISKISSTIEAFFHMNKSYNDFVALILDLAQARKQISSIQ